MTRGILKNILNKQTINRLNFELKINSYNKKKLNIIEIIKPQKLETKIKQFYN